MVLGARASVARASAARILFPPWEQRARAHHRWPCRLHSVKRLHLVKRQCHLRFRYSLPLPRRTLFRSRASLVRTSSWPCSSLRAPERCRHRCFVIPTLPKPFCRRCPTRHSTMGDHWPLSSVHWRQDLPQHHRPWAPWAFQVPHHRQTCRRRHHQSWHPRRQYRLLCRKVAHGQA